MTTVQIILLVIGIVVIDVMVIGAVASTVMMALKPLMEAHPPKPIEPDAVTKRWQTVRFGMSNFGGCISISVDTAYLHLRPARIARIFGLRDMSIAWEVIEVRDIGKRLGSAKVSGMDIKAPSWALRIGKPGAA